VDFVAGTGRFNDKLGRDAQAAVTKLGLLGQSRLGLHLSGKLLRREVGGIDSRHTDSVDDQVHLESEFSGRPVWLR
jgi:hypothetical protein